MSAIVESCKIGNTVKITIEVNFKRSIQETETEIQSALNQAGSVLTAGALEHLDTDGSPIRVGNQHLTSKGKIEKDYETPYGKVSIKRHVYQSPAGGKVYCPLDFEARIINSATPRFANIVSYKYANSSVSGVARDLEIGQMRIISNDYIHETSHTVAHLIHEKEGLWTYDLPSLSGLVATVALSLDGTCVNIRQDAWRQAMVGTISLYDKNGERLYTQYLGESPENGKGKFHERFTREISSLMSKYPQSTVIGVADGAQDNWTYLSQFTSNLCLDFFHAAGYVSKVANAVFADSTEKKEWLENRLHELKHTPYFSEKLILEMQEMRTETKLSSNHKDEIRVCQNYFENNKERMNYAHNVEKKLPIGSGVVEAGCKVLVKERLCCSGMRWSLEGCRDILQLRSLVLTDGRWSQFWQKADQFGFSNAA